MLIYLLLQLSSFASDVQYVGQIQGKQIEASFTPATNSSVNVTHERRSMHNDYDVSNESYECYSAFKTHIGEVSVDFGFEKYSGDVYAYASLFTQDDGKCAAPRLPSVLTVDFNIVISLKNEKAAISYTDTQGRTVQVYNSGEMYKQGQFVVARDKKTGRYRIQSIFSYKQSNIEVVVHPKTKKTSIGLRNMVFSAGIYNPRLEESFDLILKRSAK